MSLTVSPLNDESLTVMMPTAMKTHSTTRAVTWSSPAKKSVRCSR